MPVQYSIIYAYLMHLDILKPASCFQFVAYIKGNTVINIFIYTYLWTSQITFLGWRKFLEVELLVQSRFKHVQDSWYILPN